MAKMAMAQLWLRLCRATIRDTGQPIAVTEFEAKTWTDMSLLHHGSPLCWVRNPERRGL